MARLIVRPLTIWNSRFQVLNMTIDLVVTDLPITITHDLCHQSYDLCHQSYDRSTIGPSFQHFSIAGRAMLFADDLVSCDPDRQMMEVRLERWRECMEKNGLKVSRAKTQHLQTTEETDPVGMKNYMETEMVNLPTVQSFKYLGSTIDRRGGASKDVESRVTKAWSKWRELSGVICDKKVPTKLKILIYQTVIRPTLLYGCETWPMSVKDERRMATTEMRMVRWAMGVSLLEHRRNEEILEEAKVEQIATVMRRRRLEWFGHVKRRDETENNRAVVDMKMEGKRPRGRPKLRWKDTVKRDMKAWRIKEEWATDREKWRSLCKTRYPAQGDGGKR